MTTMRTIATLRGNWKARPDEAESGWSVTLGPSIFLTGPNGEGKSTIAEALCLLLTGAVPVFLGRKAVKDAKMLWRAKPKGASMLWVEGTSTDGVVVRWEQARSNGKPKITVNGVEADPDATFGAVLGVEEVRANLFGSPKAAEAWLTEKLRLTSEATFDLIPEDAGGRKTVEQVYKLSEDPNEVLRVLKERHAAAKAEAATAEVVTEEIQAAVGPVVTEAEIQAARDTLATAQTALATANEQASAVADLRVAATNGQAAMDRLNGLKANEAPPQITQQVQTAQTILDTLTACPCCKEAIPADRIDQRIEALGGFIAQGSAVVTAARARAEAQAAVEAARAAVQAAAGRMLPETQAAVRAGTWADPVPAATAACNTADAALREIEIRAVASQAPGMAEERAANAKDRAERFGNAVTAWESAVSTLVKGATDKINAGVAEFFPVDRWGVPVISLRPKVSVGLRQPDGGVGAPSGAQEAVLLMALAALFASLEATVLDLAAEANVEAPPVLPVILAPDTSMDDVTLRAIFAAFGDWPAGHVIAYATSPDVRPSEGWATIDLWPKGSEAQKAPEVPSNGAGSAVAPSNGSAPPDADLLSFNMSVPLPEGPVSPEPAGVGLSTEDPRGDFDEDLATGIPDDFAAILDGFLNGDPIAEG
jgi:energy-coupling factor transporter ATP-binding protein EcfA2